MGKIEKIELEVQALSPEELAQFRAWFLEYDWAAWDRQSGAMLRLVASTTLLRRPFVITLPARPHPSDPSRVPRLLGAVSIIAVRSSPLADQAYARLKEDPRIRPFTSRRSAGFGLRGSAVTIAPWPWKHLMGLYGSGLVAMPTTIDCLANKDPK